MRPKNILSPSVFDFYNGSPSFKFIRPESFHKASLDKQAITKAHLICRDLSSGLVLSGNFKLQGHLLVYYKDDVDVPILVLDLLYSRLKPLEVNLTYPKYKLKVATRGHSYELCFNKQATAEYWAESLRSICVLTNFYERYQRIHSTADNPYSQTYLIKDKNTSDVFATKRFSKENLSTSSSKAALFSEIMIMRANDHPNFLKLHEVYETDRSIYLVKEYLPTFSLHSFLSDKDLPLSHCGLKAIKIMGSLLRALDYLSSQGFMHRDLNPENILIDKDGNVKITDFGLVTRLCVTNTQTDERCGAPGYIAPEVFKYDKKVISTTYNAKCDVFSAGCIFFEILFGFPLFNGKDVIEKLKLNKTYSQKEIFQRIDKEMNDPSSAISKQDLDLLQKLLYEDPQKRLSPIEALDHDYFKPAISKTVQWTQDNDILLFSNTIAQSRDPSPLQSPILSTDRFFATNGVGNAYFSEDDLAITNRRIKSQDSNLSTANSNTRPHSLDGLNSFGPRNKTLKTSTFFEGPSSCKGTGTLKRDFKSEECDVDETEGELSDTEDEISSIEAFLDSHNIQVSMKNPGRMSESTKS